MHIRNLDLVLSDADLNKMIGSQGGKITNLRAALQKNQLVASGRAQMGLVINFTAIFSVAHTAADITASLVSFQPLNALVAPFKKKLMQKIVEFLPFARMDATGDTIRIPVHDLARHYGLEAEVVIQNLQIDENKLRVELEGKVTL